MSENPMPSIERDALNEISSNMESSTHDEKREKIASSNRKTLNELQIAAKLSPEKMNNLTKRIGNVDKCDDKRFRYVVREWITKNVPHNKQERVREEIFDSLYALVPNNTKSKMRFQERCYRSGSMEPPGYKHTCPSDYGSDEENVSGEETNSTEESADVENPVSRTAHTNTKKRHDTEDEDDQPSSKKRKTSLENTDKFDVSSIHLEGEENDSVPVYETCDMIREKIEEHLKKPGVTISSFVLALQNQYHDPNSIQKMTNNSLYSFRRKSGYATGNTSTAFYAAYCFFEKLRIKEGEAKSEDRETMEELWGGEGRF